MTARYPREQIGVLRGFAGHETLFGEGDAVTRWLLMPPRTEMSLSPPDLCSSFVSCAQFGKADDPRAQKLFSLIIPALYLSAEGFVLGYVFSLNLFAHGLPECCRRDPLDMFLEGFDSHISRFAFNTRTGQMYELARGPDSTLNYVTMSLHRYGFAYHKAATVFPDGKLLAMKSVPVCPFCSERSGAADACECAGPIAHRLYGPKVVFSSWQQVLDLGRAHNFTSPGPKIVPIDGVEPFSGPIPSPRAIDYLFSPSNASLCDIRTSYLNYLTVTTLSVMVEPLGAAYDSLLGIEGDPLEPAPPSNGAIGNDDVKSTSPWVSETVVEDVHLSASAGIRKSFQCPKCGAVFRKSTNLWRHVSAIHERKRAHRCRECGLTFAQAGNMKRHWQNVHERKKPFECASCPQAFSQRANLARHCRRFH